MRVRLYSLAHHYTGKKNSFIGKMAVRWAFLGTALNIITIVVYHMLF